VKALGVGGPYIMRGDYRKRLVRVEKPGVVTTWI